MCQPSMNVSCDHSDNNQWFSYSRILVSGPLNSGSNSAHQKTAGHHTPCPAPLTPTPPPQPLPGVCPAAPAPHPPGLPVSLMAARSWAQFRHPERLVSCLWKISCKEPTPKAKEARRFQAPPESPSHPSVKAAGLLSVSSTSRPGCLDKNRAAGPARMQPPLPVLLKACERVRSFCYGGWRVWGQVNVPNLSTPSKF